MAQVKLSGAEIVVEELKNEGVEVAFGIPGGVLLDLYEALYSEDAVRHILMRHEQCAAHAADGYARVSGKTGVCIATSGPGATNLVTGLANASMDSAPVVALTGQVPTGAIGSNAFQEASTFTITMPVTKHNFLVKRTEDLPKVIHNAFHIANTGRKGVVLIDLPKDVLALRTEVELHPKETFAGYKPNIRPNRAQIKKAVEVLVNAERPLILAGGGVISSNATDDLRMLAEFLGAPVVTTLLGKGAIPEDHPFSLGMAGMHGRIYANRAINECDALLAIGTRFSDRLTGWLLDQFAPEATLIHVDIDAAEINKNIPVDIPIQGDAKLALEEIIKGLGKKSEQSNASESVWVRRIKEMHAACEDCISDVHREGTSLSDRFIKEINRILDDDVIVTTEVGQCQMYAAHYYLTKKPRTFISSGGLGTMGFGFPAAIGAKVAAPDKQVVDIAGDGSFLMTCQDLATCMENDIPVVVCVFHNRYLGMVRQWQELFFDKKYSHTGLGATPDFVKLVEAFGGYGERVERPGDMNDALHNAFESGKPAVIDMIVGNEDKVLPMIPPGGGLLGMIGTEQCTPLATPMYATRNTIAFSSAGYQINRVIGKKRSESMSTHIVSLLVEDHPGVLTRMSGMFTMRGINIISLTVSPCEKEGQSRMTVVIDGSESVLEQVRKQLSNLIEVVKVADLASSNAIIRDLCLMKVHVKDSHARSEIMQLAESYDAKIADATLDSVILELTEEPKTIDRFVELMRHFGVKQLFRTGVTAIGLGTVSER